MVKVSLLIPAKNSGHSLEETVRQAHHFFSQNYGQSFEIILIPNPSPTDRTIDIAERLAREFQNIQVVPYLGKPGKGAAIRTGLEKASGEWIFFTDADLPYDLGFFTQAAVKLRLGYDLVTGNRRLATSYFNVPVGLLHLAYGRHRLGLWFNRLVRWLLPIYTTDTQAGIKAFSRRLAQEFLKRQSCPGFLFDLELFLTARGQGFVQTELPVTLYLNNEKSTVRVLRESLQVAIWLTRLNFKNRRGDYGVSPRSSKKILSRYQSAPLATRLFLRARWHLTPYGQMAAHLPPEGAILDMGCGHGLFSLAMALSSERRKVFGVDHDQKRIQLGNQAAQNLPNLKIISGNMSDVPNGSFSGVAMIDVMHYFDPKLQEELAKKAFDLLESGGTLIVREVDPSGGVASAWNRLYEKIATGIGFTQAEEKGLHFRSPEGWETLFKKTGFQVNTERCSSFLFADILYVCERPNTF